LKSFQPEEIGDKSCFIHLKSRNRWKIISKMRINFFWFNDNFLFLREIDTKGMVHIWETLNSSNEQFIMMTGNNSSDRRNISKNYYTIRLM